MLSVRTLAAQSGNPSSTLSLRSLTSTLTGTTDSLRAAFATQNIMQGYALRKAFSSHLGMPITPGNETRDQVTVTASGNGYLARFRSGNLLLTGSLDGKPEAKDTHEASIDLVALECRDKQEKVDEVIGSVAYIRPSDKSSGVSSIPKLDMGPDGQRIVQFSQTVYQGAFANINLACSLVEKDSGDTTKYREAFAKEIQKAAVVGATAAGVDAEALAGGEDWMRSVSLGLSNVIFDLLGADDDAYNAQTFMVPWTDMVASKEKRLEVKTLKRDDDPHEVQYTHRILLSGTDDGGDRGEYGMYFMVRTRPRPEVPEDFE
jgi:hypothetical protein